jgi:EmrB/QacA subfamily drug resistance transporter
MTKRGGSAAAARRRSAWVLALTSAASFMVALDVLVVTTALGTIRRELHATVGQLEWTLTAYNVCLAGFMMTGAALGDRFGRRRMFTVGIAGFTVGSALCALSPTIGRLIVGRIVQGVGAALVAPLALPLVSAAYPPERRGRALGVVTGVTGLATFAGPLIGGGVAQLLSWHWIFWVNVPVGVALIGLIRARVQESHGPARPVDLPGVLLATGALASLAWGLVRAASAGWAAPDVVGGLACGLLLAVAFVGYERRAAQPMLDVGLFGSRAFNATNAATVCHSAIVLGAVFLMAQFLQSELGLGGFGAGVRLLPWTGSMMVVAPLTGRLSDRIGTRPVIVGGLVLAAAGYAWLAWLSRPGVSYGELVGALVVVGIGNSSVFPALSAAVAAAVHPDELGPAAGVNNAAGEIGGVLGIAVVTLAFTAAGSFATPVTVAHGFRAACVLCAAVGAAGALAGALTPRHRPRTPDAPGPTPALPRPKTSGAAPLRAVTVLPNQTV